MNAFAWAATVLAFGYAPLLVVALRRRPIDGLIALEMGGILLVLILICLSEAFHRSFEFTVAIMAAVMTLIGGMVFARFIGRWM